MRTQNKLILTGIILLTISLVSACTGNPITENPEEISVITDSGTIGDFIAGFEGKNSRPPDVVGFRENEWSLPQDPPWATAISAEDSLVATVSGNAKGNWTEIEIPSDYSGFNDFNNYWLDCDFLIGPKPQNEEDSYSAFDIVFYLNDQDHAAIRISSNGVLFCWTNIGGEHNTVSEFQLEEGVLNDNDINTIRIFRNETSVAFSVNDHYVLMLTDTGNLFDGRLALRMGTTHTDTIISCPYLVAWKF